MRYRPLPRSGAPCMLALLAAFTTAPAAAQQVAGVHDGHGMSTAAAAAQRLRAAVLSEPVRIDGVLDERVWGAGAAAMPFTQQSPRPGEPSAYDTEVRVAVDGDAVYVAIRAQDPAPDSIVARLARRDVEVQSDWLHVALDSYGDRRSAYQFGVNAAGVKRDARITDDTHEDLSWDAVWEVAARIDEHGWNAEFRIPLAQLRYRAGTGEPWGMNVKRVVPRAPETSYWAPVPNNAGTYVSSFGVLDGVVTRRAARNVEIMPYIASRVSHDAARAKNPLRSETDVQANVGADVKMGIGPALTLRATVNPDFGQVEADPSAVNLSAYELFLPERRPFFVQGAEHFSVHGPQLFYSRRIGRAPQGRVSGASAVDMPEQATLLAAVKLTGQSGDWSIGFLDALTAREHARFMTDAGEQRALVEPATNYAVVSVERDFREGRSGLGVIATAMHRILEDGQMPGLRKTAFSGGVEGRHRFGGNRYEVRGSVLGSNVLGDTAAIAATQRGPGHYFARPDAGHLVYDPLRRSLAGASARAGVHKVAGGNWRSGVEAAVTTPGFEINDLGFYNSADRVTTGASLRYLQHEPGTYLSRWSLSFFQHNEYTTGGERIDATLTGEWSARLHNQWNVSLWGMRHLGGVDPDALRGGPALLDPGRWMGSIDVGTDPRRAVRASIGTFHDALDERQGGRTNLYAAVQVRPSARLDATLQPSFGRHRTHAQYVTRQMLEGMPTYVLGTLHQTTAAVSIRVNYTFSPTTSLQLYAQPYVSAGAFTAFRRVLDADAPLRTARYQELTDALQRVEENGTTYWQLDGNGDGEPELRWRDGSYNFRQVRSNAVFRWEFRPGSALFLAWSREATDERRTGPLAAGRDLHRLAGARGPQTLMLKVSYWLAR